MIHKTALLHRDAEIPEDIEIGPYCVVGAEVKLGTGCRLDAHVVLEGPSIIGKNNHFFPFCSIGQKSQDLKYRGEPTALTIGDQNVFREFVTINRATNIGDKTIIGHHNLLLAYAHVAHDCVLGDHIIISNNGTLAGHVTIEDRAVIGGLTAIHQFCRIGTMAITGGCSKVVQDVPPYMMADGNPAEVRTINKVGLERNGVTETIQKNLRDAFKLLYRESGLNIGEAVTRIQEVIPKSKEISHLCAFVETSTRGISR